MKIDNYFFSTKCGRPTKPEGEFHVRGEVYGRDDFEDGTIIVTSSVVEYDARRAVTRSGTVYELGKVDSDYEELLEAIEQGFSAIVDWDLEGISSTDDISESSFSIKDVFHIPSYKGVFLTGETMDGGRVCGEIIDIDDSFVRLLVDREGGEGREEREYFFFDCC